MSERKPDKYEVAATWLWRDEYEISAAGSPAEFWALLSREKQAQAIEAVEDILAAPFGTWNKSARRAHA